MSTVAATLGSWAVRDVVTAGRTRAGLGVAAFAVAITLGAQVAVPLPLTPVPVTLQTLFVVLAGVMLGPRLGALSAGAYVAIGAAGAPVFANGGAGLPWLIGPTGGYLVAAPAAAYLAGWISNRDASAFGTLTALTAGVLAMYAGGVSWLVALTGEPLATLIGLGVLPFVAGDAAKVAVAFGAARVARHKGFFQL